MTHLLVTNDFPPKTGGIQSYLWELWRRLPTGQAHVLTTSHPGADMFDREQPFAVTRRSDRVLLPTPMLAAAVEAEAARCGAGLVLLDPVLPLGLLGPMLRRPYGVVLHGAEVTVPGRLPATRPLLAHVLRGATIAVAAGPYPASEARRAAVGGEWMSSGGGHAGPPMVVVPPGVDADRFRPLSPRERAEARARWGLAPDACVVLSLSRLVPRKGMDVLIRAAGRLAPSRPRLVVAIAGAGRDRARLERLAETQRAPVRFLGRVSEDEKPAVYGVADIFAMLCRNRWWGLEQEGFGIVFLEAAACGVAQLAGGSGGAADAVEAGVTGEILADPTDLAAATEALARLVDDEPYRWALGAKARIRAEETLHYDTLARQLGDALAAAGG